MKLKIVCTNRSNNRLILWLVFCVLSDSNEHLRSNVVLQMIIKINSMESIGWALAAAVTQMFHASFAVACTRHGGMCICVSAVLASTMNLYYYEIRVLPCTRNGFRFRVYST